jgi:hypothetical protein
MNIGQKTFRITIVACLTSFGLFNQAFAQNHKKPALTTTREIERSRLSTVVPQSFDYKGLSIPFNIFSRDTALIQTLVPSPFASEITITVRDQIRREQQNSDENIVKRQKSMVESIRRKR